MSAVAHFFMAVSGSFIHERMAQLFVDIYTLMPGIVLCKKETKTF